MNQAVIQHPAQQPVFWHQEAEETVIGACLKAAVSGDTLPLMQSREQLQASDFWATEHRVIWQAMLKLVDSEQSITPFTIQQQLESEGRENPRHYMVKALEIVRSGCHPNNLPAYVTVVRKDAVRRSLISLAESLSQQAQDTSQPALELANQTAEQLISLAPDTSSNLKSAPELTDHFTQQLLERYEGKVSPMGLPTGLKDLDSRTLGLHPGQLVILAARPGMGKTTLAMNWITLSMMEKPVLFASLEMSSSQLMERFTSMLARVEGRKLKDPGGHFSPDARQLSELEFDQVTNALGQIKTSHLELVDQPGLSVNQLRTHAKKLNRKHEERGGLALVVVDYLQLMGSDKRQDNRNLEVSDQTRALKNLARELGCPVVCLSQLSRDVEKRTNKRPLPSDLRDSGSIEQDADVILFIYREEVYQPKTPFKGVTELILAKVREGEPGTVYSRTSLSQYRFNDLAPEDLARMAEDNQPTRKTGFRL